MVAPFATFAAVVLASGCDVSTSDMPASLAGLPKLPATLAVPDRTPPALPVRGPIGRGALLYVAPIKAPTQYLVLESGAQFSLPPSPKEEGRQGSTTATLSPDGRWLGYRLARYAHTIGT